MGKTRFFLMILFLSPLVSFSQNDSIPTLSKKELKKKRPAYIDLSMGFGSSNFRDFATSPLIYKGRPTYLSISHIKSDLKREYKIGMAYLSSKYTGSFNAHTFKSDVKIISIYYSQLYKFSRLSTEKLNVKIGGLLNTTTNIRINPSLQNNAVGVEIIPTLFGSIKITRDISRKKDKQVKLWFIEYHLQKRTRKLAFRFNVGLINSSYRNGFTYVSQAAILNKKKITDMLQDYQFKIFSGYRFSSALDYTISLKNKNKFQISYLWDAYKTGGNFERLEMANHTIKLTFLFNTNNK